MALIKINNTAQAISDAEEITTNTVKIDSCADSIEYILNELKQYWEQTQEDAQSFSDGLRKNVEKLKTIVECNKEFAEVIKQYAELEDKTGQKTVA